MKTSTDQAHAHLKSQINPGIAISRHYIKEAAYRIKNAKKAAPPPKLPQFTRSVNIVARIFAKGKNIVQAAGLNIVIPQLP